MSAFRWALDDGRASASPRRGRRAVIRERCSGSHQVTPRRTRCLAILTLVATAAEDASDTLVSGIGRAVNTVSADLQQDDAVPGAASDFGSGRTGVQRQDTPARHRS